tara:strand:+ start:4654 stop:6303 length:1650 start_codon:yes stop_codon:yes gene_type:complete
MAWESLLKVRPFLSDEQVKIANALTIAGATNEPVDLSEYDTRTGKISISKLTQKIERVEDEEFEEKFKQVNWKLEDKEDYLRMLKEYRQSQPTPKEIDKPYLKDKIEDFLEGNHDGLLELIERSKRRGLFSAIQSWNKVNNDMLRDYVKDKPELAEKMKKVFRQLESSEEMRRQVSPSSIGDDTVLEYVKMISNELTLPPTSNVTRLGKESYLPVMEGLEPKFARRLFGLAANQGGNIPPATSYILENDSVNFEEFMVVADTKSSTVKEILYNKLRRSEFDNAVQEEWDRSESIVSFENSVAADREMSKEFKSMLANLGEEMKVESVDVKFSIPKDAYDKMMSGEWDESLEVYGINSDDALEDMLDEHEEDLKKLQEKVKGFVRPVDMETKKRLEESELLQDEGIELWNNDGSLKQITSEETSEKAFPKYLQTLAEIDEPDRAIFFAAEDNKNQVMLGDFVYYLSLTELTYQEKDSDVRNAVNGYAREQSDENRKKLDDELSTSKYKEIRNEMLLAIKEKMATLLSEYNTNMLHERKTIEPLDWLRENI